MWTRRSISACATAALCTALLLPAGCKKKEEAKPAAPAAAAPAAPVEAAKPAAIALLPDVELAAGEGIAGWLSLKSIGAAFDVAESIGGKVGAVPAGGSLRQGAYDQLTTLLMSVGITGHDWLDKTRAMHIAFQDEKQPDPAPGAVAAPVDPQGGVFVVLPITDKAKTLAAMAAAKKGAEAEGHEALIVAGAKSVYVDFNGNNMVLTLAKDRFAKVKGFVERLTKIEVPALVYLGISVDDVAKTRQKELDAFMGQMEQMGGQIPGAAAGQPQVMAAYGKMMRGWITDLNRVELLIGADKDATRLEVRMTAKEGSKLATRLNAGKGRTPKEILGLLPANSYLSFGASVDPTSVEGSLDESLVMVKDMLKLDDATYAAFVADVKTANKLQDGTSAVALYPDGKAALGALVIAGSTDGDAVLKAIKHIATSLIAKVIADQKAAAKAANPAAPDDPKLAIVEGAIKEGKIDPILTAFGPIAKEMGVTLTAETVKAGDATCDVLHAQMDWAKLATQGGEDAKKGELLLGDQAAIALCSSKAKMALVFGPSALETGKKAVAGTAGGLNDAAGYKAATAKIQDASWQMYLNPGAAMAACKVAFPEIPAFPTTAAAVASCQNHVHSVGCTLEVPVELIAAIKAVAMPAAPAAAPGAAGIGAPGVAPAAPVAPKP